MPNDNKTPAADSRRDGQTRAQSNPNQVLHDKLDRLLAKSKPSKRAVIQRYFNDMYVRLETHLANGVPLKEILVAFNELAQAKVCARTFNEMLEQERASRDREGNPLCCPACSTRLATTMPTKPVIATCVATPNLDTKDSE